MVDHGQDGFAHRAFGDYVHAPAGRNQCRSYLFFFGDSGDTDFRTFCLRLGLSHSSPAGLLCLAAKEGRPYSEGVSIEAAGLCAAHSRSVYVRMAHSLLGFIEARTRTTVSRVHQSYCYQQFLGDFPLRRDRHSFSFHLRFHDGLFFGLERLLHLRLPLWRVLQSR